MLKRLSSREKFEQLIANFEPLIRKAFEDAVEDIRSNIQLRRIVERLERNDIIGAIEALHIDRAAFNPVENAIRLAYNAGGTAAVAGMPALRDPEGHRLVVWFDVRNIRAERWLAEHSSNLITAITADMREAARVAMTVGMEEGRNPRSTALDVVGRINRATGKREGGILGLTSTQAEYIASARQELLSGDPAALRHYLTRNRRDRRFDRTVLAAIKDEKAMPVDMVDRMLGRYSDSLLLLRGETVARTETLSSLNASTREAFEQAIAVGNVSRQDVRKVWKATKDNRTRDTHRVLDGESVGMDEAFTSPSGARLQFPGDPSAPASEIIACRCFLTYRIDYLANIE
ncbi:phage Mu protein F like protein [Pseudaminobacter salicylatoxidans]|uniref:Phage Mu protein F like protein n=1 Tax=Pseudaminobacter salicylatoxidans TaxID=93369 RepID=A0A316C1Q1_PSESE|nr:phage minor head protein [Pseudaminobacter salicylatoxidans]PWJ80641.1 phage Mu protein F like protein [Pseudaminobacter salicylatoxidans]